MSERRREVSAEEYETVKAVLGLDAEAFRRSNLGRYIFDRIEVEQEQLIQQLIEMAAKSSDVEVAAKAIEINMQRMLPKYIKEAIASGYAAERNIDLMESSAAED